MRTEELERLLWERFDGSLGAADRARLEEHLTSHPAARRLEAEIASLAEELDRVPEAPTPPAVSEGIRAAIDGASPIREPRPDPSGVSLFGGLFRRPEVRRLAWAAAGLVVAVIAFQLATGTVERDPGVFSGSAGLAETAAGATTFELASGAALGLRRQSDELWLDLELTPELPAARISVTGRGLTVRDSDRGGGASFVLEETGGGFRITAVGPGRVRLALLVPDPESPLEITVEADGEPLLVFPFRLEELAE